MALFRRALIRRSNASRHRAASAQVHWKGPLLGVAVMLVAAAAPAGAVVILANTAGSQAIPAASPAAASTSSSAPTDPAAAADATAAAREAALRAGAGGSDAAPASGVATATIAGQVTGFDGALLEGVRVAAYAAKNGALVGAPVGTTTSGTYQVTVAAGDSVLLCLDASAAAPGYASICTASIAAPAGSTGAHDVTLPPIGSCEPGAFVDVPATFCADITWLAGSGITTGTDQTHFSPAARVTRGQMALFLYRMQHPGQPDPTCSSRPFDDVPVTAPACGAISWLVQSGITQGLDDSHFGPLANVTRGQMALFLYRLAYGGAEAPACSAPPFDDVPVTSPACGAITWLAAQGITTGTGPTHSSYLPATSVSRGQLAAFLHRMHSPVLLTGTVTTREGVPIPGVSVMATGINGTGVSYSTVTDAAGQYTMSTAKPGTYAVCFDAAPSPAPAPAAPGTAPATPGPAPSSPQANYAYECFDNIAGAGKPTAVTLADATRMVSAQLAVPSS